MSDFVWLDIPFHKNKFKALDIEELETLKVSFDGSIMAVRKECVESFYNKNDVELVKAGYKKIPENMKIENEDNLYEFLAYFVSM